MVSTRSKSGASSLAPAPEIVKKRTQKATKPANTSTATPKTALKVLPEVSLLNDAGTHVNTISYVTDDFPGLIVFTYPRANTPGCTTQATGLSALKNDAEKAGYRIVGVSYDSPKSQAGWKVKRAIELDLLCDTLDIGLLKKLGAHKAPKGVKRSVFVFRREEGKDAVSAMLVRYNISPKDCVHLITGYIKENPCKKTAESEDKKNDTPKDKPVVAEADATSAVKQNA